MDGRAVRADGAEAAGFAAGRSAGRSSGSLPARQLLEDRHQTLQLFIKLAQCLGGAFEIAAPAHHLEPLRHRRSRLSGQCRQLTLERVRGSLGSPVVRDFRRTEACVHDPSAPRTPSPIVRGLGRETWGLSASKNRHGASAISPA